MCILICSSGNCLLSNEMTMKTDFFSSGDKRSLLIKKNIAGSLLIKGWSCVIQFLVVPLSLNCLTKYEYGIWLTINSLLLGIDAIDVGLGNGLRNRLAQAMAKGDRELAHKQVSTAFFLLVLVITPLILLGILLVDLIDCYALFNVDYLLVPNYDVILKASIAIMGCNFIFKFIGSMYMGLQLPAINNMLVVMGQTLATLGLLVMYLLSMDGLLPVVLVFTLSPLAIYLLAWPFSFYGKYDFLRPSINTFDIHSVKNMISLGFNFFIIQVTGLMLFMSSNVILSIVLTPAEVTPYQVSYRYYSLQYVLFSIIALPFWSATTDAYTKGDWNWIRNAMRRMRWVLLACLVMALVMLFSSDLFFHLWVGDKVEIPLSLSLLMVVYCFLLVVSNMYSVFLFGIGKIRIMVITSLVSVLFFVPMQYFSCMWYGTCGLIVSLIIATMVMITMSGLQYYKLSNNKATGLWDK